MNLQLSKRKLGVSTWSATILQRRTCGVSVFIQLHTSSSLIYNEYNTTVFFPIKPVLLLNIQCSICPISVAVAQCRGGVSWKTSVAKLLLSKLPRSLSQSVQSGHFLIM